MVDMPIEDRLAIHELINRYAFYCDTAQADAVVDLFMDDGVFDETSLGFPLNVGTAALREVFTMGVQVMKQSHHMTTWLIEEFDGDTAGGICYVHAECQVAATGRPYQVDAYYRDVYAKIDGNWRFRSRVLTPLLPPQPFFEALEEPADAA